MVGNIVIVRFSYTDMPRDQIHPLSLTSGASRLNRLLRRT